MPVLHSGAKIQRSDKKMLHKERVNPDHTQELLHQPLEYEADTGNFRWRLRPPITPALRGWNTKCAWAIAGTRHNSGGWIISIDRHQCCARRCVWIYHNGPIPDDHSVAPINGDYTNRRIENLSIKRTGVDSFPSDGKVYWRVWRRASDRYVGCYKTQSEAIAARYKAMHLIAN